jgi:hypothetical protein
MKSRSIAVLVLVLGFLAFGRFPPPAQALSNPLGELLGGAEGDRVACGETPTAIAPSYGGTRPKSMTIVNNHATVVYLGGASVDSSGGASVCSADCDFTNTFSYDGSKLFCRVASGTRNVKVIWSY